MSPASSTPSRAEDRIRREAAAWFAKLRGPDGARGQAEFEAWRSADPAHAAMFERLSQRWAESAILSGSARSVTDRWRSEQRPGAGLRWGLTAGLGAGAALAAAALLAATFWPPASDLAPPLRLLGWSAPIATPVSEIRRIRLPDGSWVTLDSDTAIARRDIGGLREIRLLRGRIEVETPGPARRRPLRVIAGGASISSSAGAFDVAVSADRTASVALVSGRVTVDTAAGLWPARRTQALAPGQQLRVARDGAGAQISPAPAYESSWVRGVLDFQDTPLGEAVAEVNRYSAAKIVLQDPSLGDLRISGRVYPLATADFARGAAAMFHLTVTRTSDGAFVLSRAGSR